MCLWETRTNREKYMVFGLFLALLLVVLRLYGANSKRTAISLLRSWHSWIRRLQLSVMAFAGGYFGPVVWTYKENEFHENDSHLDASAQRMRNAVSHKLYIRVFDHIPTYSRKHTTIVHSHNISQRVIFNFDNIFAGIIHFGFDDLGDSTRNNWLHNGLNFFMPTSRWTASDGSGAFIFQS